MEPEVAGSGSWLVTTPVGPEAVLASRDGVWVKTEEGADVFARLPEGERIHGPADTGATASGDSFALSTDQGQWYELRLATPGETCTLPQGWRGP
jgi:hypothetical protein